MLRRLGDPAARDDIRAEIAAHGLNAFGHTASWDAVRISTSPCSNEIGHIRDGAADALSMPRKLRCDRDDAMSE